MYGVEAASTGLGGLASQAPAADQYLARSLLIRPSGGIVIGQQSPGGTGNDFIGSIGNQAAGAMVSAGGGAVQQPTHTMMSSWRQVLDWHNSPAPWILGLILLLYGWLHVSVHASAGRRASASAVL